MKMISMMQIMKRLHIMKIMEMMQMIQIMQIIHIMQNHSRNSYSQNHGPNKILAQRPTKLKSQHN